MTSMWWLLILKALVWCLLAGCATMPVVSNRLHSIRGGVSCIKPLNV